MSTQKDSFTLKKLVLYFLYLGSCCFGGPVALVGYIQKDLVERNKWFSNEEFMDGFAFSKLAPGPLAVQLGMYLGYLRFNVLGATLTLLAFVIPPTLIVIMISYIYVKYNGLPWIHNFLYGLSPAVIGIIFKASYNLAKNTIKKDLILIVIFLISLTLSIFTKFEMFLPMIFFGFIYMVIKKRTHSLLSLPLLVFNNFDVAIKNNPSLTKLFFFFFKAGALIFGSGFAIIPFLQHGVVYKYHWLTDKQFVDAVAIGMATPGPVLVTVTFIGYLLKGLPGAIISTIAIFLPVYLFVVFLSPVFKKFSKNESVNSFIRGITAFICGSILASCFLLTQKTIVDIPTFLIALISTILIFKSTKIPDPLLILFFGFIGLILKST